MRDAWQGGEKVEKDGEDEDMDEDEDAEAAPAVDDGTHATHPARPA